MEKIRDSNRKAEEYADYSGPLTVDTEIPRREFLRECHFCFVEVGSGALVGFDRMLTCIDVSFETSTLCSFPIRVIL